MDLSAISHFAVASGIDGFMNSAWGWPVVEALHFIALAVLLGTVGLFDLRMLGFAKHLPAAALHRLVPWGVGAFVANIATGAMFFVSAPDQYAYNPAFQSKVLCILLAGLNAAVFYSGPVRQVKSLPAKADAPTAAKIIGCVSLLSWLAVIVLGRLITMFRPPYHWCWWC
jgi:hypothetical protein